MGKYNVDLLRVVAEDLVYLKTEWDNNIKDSYIRIGSSILRRLLVEGLYGNAWRNIEFTKSPRILSPLKENIDSLDFNKIEFYQSGGAESNGIEIQDLVVYNEVITPTDSKKNYEKVPLYLQQFTNETCMIIESVEISRRSLIQYVANKAGGVHYDPKLNDKPQEILNELDNKTAGRDSIYYEVLSIAQLLNNSRDTDKYIKKVKDIGIKL